MENKENKEMHQKTKKVLELSRKNKQKTLTNSDCDTIEVFNSNGQAVNNIPNKP